MSIQFLNEDKQPLSAITHYMKYAKYLESEKRRETFEETIQRNRKMHLNHFKEQIKENPQLKKDIDKIYKDFVLTGKILPSMRSIQFGGNPIEINPVRSYNCSFVQVRVVEVFSEAMFLLLSGCFSGETLVKTYSGDKRLDEITNEDIILTYDENNKSYEWTRPLAVGETPTEDKEKYELEFGDGTVVKCTSDHKFLTSNRGWVEAKDLTEEDDIVEFE
jgi:hypothetical protein